MKDFFETKRAEKHPPPEEKIDPVKAKRTLNALKRAPPHSSDNNHLRCLKKIVQEARQSGTTSTDKRLKEQRSGKKIPQLGEQENQSFPPLKVSSDIVANQPLLPDFTINYYLPNDVEFETMEVDDSNTITGSLSLKILLL